MILDAKRIEEKYSTKEVPWGPLGYIVFKRTYAWPIHEENRTEEWWETCFRVVNGLQEIGAEYTEQEAYELYHYMFHLKGLPSGRAIWQLGKRLVREGLNDSMFNCWFTKIEKYSDFCFLFHELMLGGGVGFSATSESISKLPNIKKLNSPVVIKNANDADFIVPDSREGWVSLLRRLMKSYFVTGKGFSYSLHCLRSAGAPIKGFGGKSSGPIFLENAITNIIGVFERRISLSKNNPKLTSVDVLDIGNIIGECVSNGNVRRCLPGRSHVLTINGEKELKDLKVGQLVLTPIGFREIKNKWKQGVQECIKITLENGDDFVCTPNHRMAITTNGSKEYEWIEASKLTPRDSLAKISTESKKLYYEAIIEDGDWNNNANSLTVINDPVRIKSVTPYHEAETYDIEVEETNNFYCEEYLTHNSAQICIGDQIDDDFIKAKRWDLHTLPSWRKMSNNTIMSDTLPENNLFWDNMGKESEDYGFFNRKLSREKGRTFFNDKRPDNSIEGGNPCMEIPLGNKENCNLAELVLPNISNTSEAKKIAQLLFQGCKAIAKGKFIYKETQDIVRENMRIGINANGLMQEHNVDLEAVYNHIQEFDAYISKKWNINKSIRTTTVQPSGTKSKLSGCTEGLSPWWSKYCIVRMYVDSKKTIPHILQDCGYHVEPLLKSDGEYDHSTMVISFPVQSPPGAICNEDTNAIKQLEYIKKIQGIWSDNSISCSVTYSKEEVPEIKKWLKENYQDYIKSLSFILKSGHGFKQAMRETISRDTYFEMKKNLKTIPRIEECTYQEAVESECAGGSCPVR